MTYTYATGQDPNDNMKEFQEEINSWKKMLRSRMEENIGMKNMLGDLLKKNYDQDNLEQIEEFQNKFIREDEMTDMLRNDMIKFDELSYGQVFKEEKNRESCKKRMEKLRNDIIRSENHFSSLIASFDDFVCKTRV